MFYSGIYIDDKVISYGKILDIDRFYLYIQTVFSNLT